MEKTRWWKLSLAALKEIVIICVASAVVLVALRLLDFFQREPDSGPKSSRAAIAVDSELTIKSVDFSKHPLSFVLITSPTCPYCLASKPFHQTVQLESQHRDVPFYVAVPSRKDAAAYLRDAQFAPQSVREWNDLSLSASGTPTLIAVNKDGKVKRVWIGQLPTDRESSVLDLIRNGSLGFDSSASDTTGVANYSSQDLIRLRKHRKIRVVDTHERDFPRIRPDAIVIPIEELFFRAPNELDQDALQIVDCSSLPAAQCQRSVEVLEKSGFRVATLDAGTYEAYCRAASVQ